MDDVFAERRARTERDHEYFENMDAVFNAYTWRALLSLMNKKIVDEVLGPIAQGKEARVILARGADGEYIVLKIFYTLTSTFIKSRYQYILGDPRFKNKKIKNDIYNVVEAWCRKEFGNLAAAREAGVKVPRPIAFEKNILVMEFIGAGGSPAPTLSQVGLEGLEDPDEVFWEVLRNMERAYALAGLVHADLSEFNILYNGGIVIIDWGSAVKRGHPKAEEYLVRDLGNVVRFFGAPLDPARVAKIVISRASAKAEEDEEGWLIVGGKALYEELA